ncbi:hypothetical protein [Bowdeniella nasicola]|uniref:hypothetical protein n=1 Tax=Bowdeniella nasicola TaxID=208480 RepID=UPI001161167C|nr:hypothetical protein [Bowdeniella nasicola]
MSVISRGFALIAFVGMLKLAPNTRDTHTPRSLAMCAIVFSLIEANSFGWVRRPEGGIALAWATPASKFRRFRSARPRQARRPPIRSSTPRG